MDVNFVNTIGLILDWIEIKAMTRWQKHLIYKPMGFKLNNACKLGSDLIRWIEISADIS